MSLGKTWGPATWYIFHSISYNWDFKFINHYRKFFNLIARTIPCHTCKRHFLSNIKKPKWVIRNNVLNKEKMINWLIDLHNEVNRRNRKRLIPYDNVRGIYLRENGELKYYRERYFIFMREFIFYNFKFQFKKSIEILKLLAYIFPEPRRRAKLTHFVNKHQDIKKFGLFRWLRRYKNILM